MCLPAVKVGERNPKEPRNNLIFYLYFITIFSIEVRMIHTDLNLPTYEIEDFCRRNHIRKLSIFGSAMRDDFGPESDVDFLVEFLPGHIPGLMGIARMELELSAILHGRKVDLRTIGDLSPYFRDEVRAAAMTQYEQR
jgi:uncharacterized protein